MSDDTKLVTAGFASLIFGGILFFNSFTTFRRKQMIENTPTSKIRSLAMGNVEIYGKVIPNKHDLIRTPFTGANCVYCKWTVEEWKTQGKHSKWVTINSGSDGRYFFLNDDTGLVLVDPKQGEIDIPLDIEFELSDKTSQMTLRKLEELKISYKGFFGFKKIRIKEYYLAHGDKVFVMGTAGKNPFVKDGGAAKNEDNVMIQKSKNGFFYISDRSEKEVISIFGLRAWSGMLGGGALILFGLFILFASFRIL